jgi:hypothetical protein
LVVGGADLNKIVAWTMLTTRFGTAPLCISRRSRTRFWQRHMLKKVIHVSDHTGS